MTSAQVHAGRFSVFYQMSSTYWHIYIVLREVSVKVASPKLRLPSLETPFLPCSGGRFSSGTARCICAWLCGALGEGAGQEVWKVWNKATCAEHAVTRK